MNCKDAGDPVCTHTMYGETEEELLENAKRHGIEAHGYTEESFNEEIAKNLEHFRSLIKTTQYISLNIFFSYRIMVFTLVSHKPIIHTSLLCLFSNSRITSFFSSTMSFN